jgi:hypothetical protein
VVLGGVEEDEKDTLRGVEEDDENEILGGVAGDEKETLRGVERREVVFARLETLT